MTDFSIIAVFFVGLLGGVHCVGMCGSIVGIFTAQLPKPSPEPSPTGARWTLHLAYNGGRLASYMAAGALAGAVGQAGLLLRDAVPVQHLLFALSSLMLIALGLYLAGIWGMVRRIEQVGGVLWQYIQPLARGLLPITTPSRALLFGALWGWLPCGLVYSVLVTALASGNPQGGALIMLAFGLGTLPNLLAIGLFWENISRRAQSPRVRLTAGLLVAGLGVYGLIKTGYTFYLYGWSGSCHVAA
ncbi:MAG: sulfite exporter TauE/SafE family protein [Nitrosomonadales bacterium]|nr:sulfite exporter TauE/SafE family protein [Nitrosomonadales bacterium]